MRILLVAKPWKGGLAHYLYRTLEALFPGEVCWLPTRPVSRRDRWAYQRGRARWQQRLLERIGQGPWQTAIFINPLPVFEELPRRSEHVLWLTDGPRPRAGELHPYGRVFVADPGYAADVEAVVGAERFAGTLPFACFPSLHHPAGNPIGRAGVCFIGNRDPRRDEPLARLLRSGLTPTIVGNNFMHHPLFWRYPHCFRPPVAFAKQGAVYGRHLISINVHATIVRQGTNMRTFEAAAFGIPQLVEYRPGLEEFFTPGREIAIYRQPDELLPRLQELLAEPARALAMAALARERALREHTYGQRVRRLLAGLVKVPAGSLPSTTRNG